MRNTKVLSLIASPTISYLTQFNSAKRPLLKLYAFKHTLVFCLSFDCDFSLFSGKEKAVVFYHNLVIFSVCYQTLNSVNFYPSKHGFSTVFSVELRWNFSLIRLYTNLQRPVPRKKSLFRFTGPFPLRRCGVCLTMLFGGFCGFSP